MLTAQPSSPGGERVSGGGGGGGGLRVTAPEAGGLWESEGGLGLAVIVATCHCNGGGWVSADASGLRSAHGHLGVPVACGFVGSWKRFLSMFV